MCELLALSTSQPTRMSFSLHALAAHGGENGNLRDGWGVAFYHGEDVALFREPMPAVDSALVRYLESHGPKTRLALSHIRHATQGAIQLSNTQPFVRELGGRTHVFAHNGHLQGVWDDDAGTTGPYRAVGQTDSERAFCVLLMRLSPLWTTPDPPSLEARMTVLADFAAEMRQRGTANFFYADSDALFVHSHRRLQTASKRVEPPGLWWLQKQCPATEPTALTGVSVAGGERSALFVASVPLTDEAWQPLAEGELLAVRDGALLMRRLPELLPPPTIIQPL